MAEKHAMQIAAHENEFGKLGVLRVPPTEEELEQDFEDRRAKGELFTQQMGVEEQFAKTYGPKQKNEKVS